MMRGIRPPPRIRVEVWLSAPLRPPAAELRDTFFAAIGRLTLGVVRGEPWRLKIGPLTLFEFGQPEPRPAGWAWPIGGGVLARRPGGWFAIEWRNGRLVSTVHGYVPWLPLPLYRAAQLPVHRLLTRLFLLLLRGRVPPPGVPAGPAQRLLAAATDLGVCSAAALMLGRGRRRLATFLGLAIAYHLAAWSTTGATLGGALLGQRVVSVDGGRPRLVQAVVRMAALPLALMRLRAVHDEAALTEVVETPP